VSTLGVAVGVYTGVEVLVGVLVGVDVRVAVGVGVAVFVGVGVGVGGPVTRRHWENSDVLFAGSVAVVVMNQPSAMATGNTTLTLALPLALVLTLVKPTYVLPSP
jgi:hypothetical protein